MYRLSPHLILGLFVFVAVSAETAAAANSKKLQVKDPAALFTAVSSNGTTVSCLNRGGSVSSGISSIRGSGRKQRSYFTPAAGALDALAKKMRKARKKPEKLAALQAQYDAIAAQVRAGDAACIFASGEVPPPGMLPPAESLAPLSRPATYADIAYLLDRAGYGLDGGSQSIIDTGLQQGIAAGINEFMRYKDEYSGFTDFTNDRLDEKRGVTNLQNNLTFRGQRQAWLARAFDTYNPFIYRLHECYHGIWTTGVNVLSERSSKTPIWQSYAELLFMAAQNNDRIPDTVLRIGRHPMMLFYLSNNNNRRGSPNENYARELQELFTLGTHLISPGHPSNGMANYLEYRENEFGERVQAQGDIRRIARRLTGHRAIEDTNENGVKEWKWAYLEADHEAGPEVIYEGTPWAFSAESDEDVVRGIFSKHPAAANHLALQLLKCFLTEKPSENLVASLGAELKRNDWRVWPTLSTLFQSEAFYSDAHRGTLTLSPYTLVVKQVRVLGVRPLGRWDSANPNNEYGVNVADLESRLSNNIGFRLNQPETVFWYFSDKFISPGTLLNVSNTLDRVSSGYGTEQQRIGWTIRSVFPHEGLNSELAVRSVAPKLNIYVTDDQLSTLRFYLDNSANSNGSYTARPFETLSEASRDSKIRTLTTLLSMFPVNLVR